MASTALQRQAATPYEEHRDYVLAVLARRCGWLDPSEREEMFHDAYVVLLQKERDGVLDPSAMHAQQIRAYLVQTAIHKALDEGKRAGRKRSAPLDEPALAAPDPGRALDDLTAASLDGARVREIVAELPPRAQLIVKLRYFFDRTPAEIQTYLGISERTYRKELERSVRRIAERYELVREGRFCDSQRSLMLAYIAGVAGPNRAREARAHLATCRGCARWAADMRAATRRAAAMLPLPPVLPAPGVGDRLPQAAEDIRDAAVHVVGWLKQHAFAIASRVDPSAPAYAAGARPGAVVAIVAGCVAVGGSATYCALEGLPEPLRPAAVREHAAEPKPQQRPTPRRRPARVPRWERPPRRVAAAVQAVRARPHKPQPRRPERPSPRRAQARAEFGLEGGGAAPPPTSASPPVRRPTRLASTNGREEFGP